MYINYIIKLLLSLALTLLLISCSTYTSKPLIDAEIDQTLSMPDVESINTIVSGFGKKNLPIIDFNKALTVQQLALLTVITNPDLKALRAKNSVANAQVFEAGLLPDPQFTPLYEIPISSGVGVTPAYAFGLNWDIGSVVTKSLRESAAEFVRQQVHYGVAWQEWMTANQAELLATHVYYLQQQIRLIEQEITANKVYLDVLKVNLVNHDLKADEFNLQQSNFLDLQDQLLMARRLLDKTKLQLNQIVGLPPTAIIQLQINPNQTLPHLNESALFTYARHNRLDLLALQAGYNSQEIQLHQAILGQFPHFNVGIYPGQDNTSNSYFGTNISFDIPLFNRNQGAIAIAKATREQLYLEYIARLHSTQSDIAIIVKEISWAQAQQNTINHEMPQLSDIDTAMYKQLKLGNITQSYYLNAHTNVFNKRLKQLSLEQDIAEQRIAMQMLLGKYLGE